MNAMSPLVRSARMLSIQDVEAAFRRVFMVKSDRVNAALDELEELSERRRTAPPPPGVERDPPELVAMIERLREHYKAGGRVKGFLLGPRR